MSNSPQQNPYAPPSTISESAVRPQFHRACMLRALTLSQCAVIPVAIGAAACEIKSIIFSGPIFGLIGLSIAVIAWRRKDAYTTLLGMSAPVFAIIVFAFIFSMKLDTRMAYRPVQNMLFGYALMALPFAWLLLRARLTPNAKAEEQSHAAECGSLGISLNKSSHRIP